MLTRNPGDDALNAVTGGWHSLIESRQALDGLLQRLAEPAKAMLLATGSVLG